MTAAVLYVHPRSQLMFREIIPLSIPALVDRIPVPVAGRYEEELTRADVRAARVAFMDIHWYLSLPAALELSRRLKRWNPHLAVIAGGMTASIYAKQLVRCSEIDYVIRGDGEEPLRQLVAALLVGGDPGTVPNLHHRDFTTPWTYTLTPEILDELEFNRFEFFPSFHRGLVDFHARPGTRPFSTHPFWVPLRGCPLPCEHCVGSLKMQQALFRRGPVRRSPARLLDDLRELSADSRMRYVNVFHDFIGLEPITKVRETLCEEFDLDLYYEFARLPSPEALASLMAAFRGGVLQFSIDRFHVTSDRFYDAAEIIPRLKQAQNDGRYTVRLAYSKELARANPAYRQTLREALRATRCVPWDASAFWSDYPRADAEGNGSDADFAVYSSNRGRRFTRMNLAVRAGLALQRIAPRTVDALGNLFIGRNLYT